MSDEALIETLKELVLLDRKTPICNVQETTTDGRVKMKRTPELDKMVKDIQEYLKWKFKSA